MDLLLHKLYLLGSLPSQAQSEELKPPKGRKTSTGNGLRITDRTNMASLANFIIPQLNEVQKNLLGTFHDLIFNVSIPTNYNFSPLFYN